MSGTTVRHRGIGPARGGFDYDTADDRVFVDPTHPEARTRDGRLVCVAVVAQADRRRIDISVTPAAGVVRCGFVIAAEPKECFTGVMERVVDEPQSLSWEAGIKEAMNLRGQKINVILKPTTSVYAPFFLSGRGYGLQVHGTWPGRIDFAASHARKVVVQWEGSSLGFMVSTGPTPAAVVRAHAQANLVWDQVRWLESQGNKTIRWIAPFFQGRMEATAPAKGYTLAGQPAVENNYPMVDFTHPEAMALWQGGITSLLKLGAADFKLDRAEEDIPEDGPFTTHAGRPVREIRNVYPVHYIKAADTGNSPYAVFWGGDSGGAAWKRRVTHRF